MVDLAVRLLVGLLPVLLFLAALVWLDSYKLIGLRPLLLAIAAGGLTAAAGYAVNVGLLELTGIDRVAFTRYVAPAVEELAKAVVVVVLIRADRVGFLVDAAIFGFAVGAGFAVVENLYYLNYLHDAHVAVWIVRGFGTAIMHGGTTAIFALVTKTLVDREQLPRGLRWSPGLLAAAAVHSFFNHFLLSPVVSTVLVLVTLPPLIALAFQRSEAALRRWLDVGFDADARLLELIGSGTFTESRIGRYLQSLRDRFAGEVVVDMLCYLRLHTELSLRAKGELMMREAGLRSEIEPEIRAKFREMKYLERSIGPTGRLAMMPFLHVSGRTLWQLYVLDGR